MAGQVKLLQQADSESETWERRPIIPFQTNERNRRSIKFNSENVAKPLISMKKNAQTDNFTAVGEGNPHIRNTRDGTTIMLAANGGVYTMVMWGLPR